MFMTTPRFIPFGLEDDDVEEFFALTEELSSATMELLRDWIIEQYGNHGFLPGKALVAYASQAKKSLDVSIGQSVQARHLSRLFPRTKELLGFIHFLLHVASNEVAVRELRSILLRGHSIYTAAYETEDAPARVERRLPEKVADAVRHVASKSDTAGQKLTKAWNYAYGFEPDASVAYSYAIKAVEILACPKVAPGDTLGGVIRTLWQESKDWSFVLTEPNPSDKRAVVPVEVVASNMKMLWRGQVDRHGSDPKEFRDVTDDEAQAAVLLAATLVGWLNDGYLVKS